MTKKQEFLLKMLDEIHDICTRNNIQFFLAGGTLIGALRNKGFLPWDDDADIYMTRKEYGRFEEACKTQLPPNRVLQTPLDLTYTNTFPRYTSMDTTAIHSNQVLNGEFYGEVIDIFVLDPAHYDEDTIKSYTYDLMLYSDLVNYSSVFGRRFGVKAEDFEKYRLIEKEKGSLYIRKFFEDRLASYLSEDGEIYIHRWGGNPILFQRSWFDQARTVEFEGRNFPAGAGIDEYLIKHYGDEWYQVPCVSEQASHDTASSLEITPEQAGKIFRVENAQEMKEKLDKRKIGLLEDAKEDYALAYEKLLFEASIVVRDTMSRFERFSGELSEEFSPDDILTYEKIFGHYIEWQFSARIAGRDDWKGVHRFNEPVLGKISAKATYALLQYLFNTEKINRASRLIQIISQTGELDEYEISLNDSIIQMRKARADLQYGKLREACDGICDLLIAYPYNKSALKIGIEALSCYERETGCLFSGDDGNENFTAQELIIRGRKQYPSDGDFAFYQIKHERESVKGELTAQQTELLDFAVMNTRNGWVLRSVLEMEDAAHNHELLEKAEIVASGGELASGSASSEFAKEAAGIYTLLQKAIADVCQKADVMLFMNPLQARAVLNNEEYFTLSQNAYVLYMGAWDLERLINYLSGHPGVLPEYIEYEYMGNNKTFPDLTVRFYNTGTTNLNVRHCRRYNHTGMFVSVQVFKPKKFRKLIKYPLGLWQKTCYVETEDKFLRKLKLGIHEKTKKMFFSYVMRNCKKTRKFRRIELGGNQLVYHTDLFENPSLIENEGAKFYIPDDAGRYLMPVEEKLEEGKLSFEGKRWLFSPRGSLTAEEYESYKELLHRQSVRRKSQKWQRKIRNEFDAAFQNQKNLIAMEEAALQEEETYNE